MVYNPSGHTARSFAGFGVFMAALAVIMTVVALESERESTSLIAAVTAVLSASMAAASVVAIFKVRRAG